MKIWPRLLVLLLLTACAGAHGPGYLHVQNQRSGESGGYSYRDDGGRILPDGVQSISYLMRDTRTNEGMLMDVKMLDFLVEVRNELGLSPNALIVITSGYRSPNTNADLRSRSPQVAENSYHMRGMAIDFKIPGVPGEEIARTARNLRLGGVAFYPSSQHVHIDSGPVRGWSTY